MFKHESKSINVFCSPRSGSTALIQYIAVQNPGHINLDEYFTPNPSPLEDKIKYEHDKKYITKIIHHHHPAPAWFDVNNSFNIYLERKDKISQILSWYYFRASDTQKEYFDKKLMIECKIDILRSSFKPTNIRFDQTVFFEDIIPLLDPNYKTPWHKNYNQFESILKKDFDNLYF